VRNAVNFDRAGRIGKIAIPQGTCKGTEEKTLSISTPRSSGVRVRRAGKI
jgi:hypothetical protein